MSAKCARPGSPEPHEKILKAASEIIEACGPDCVTMCEVAEKTKTAGVLVRCRVTGSGA